MSKPDQWRDRYLQLSEQTEKAAKRFQSAEQELLRLITRLCVAASGFDASLDPHLERVRETARKGDSVRLVSQAQDLGDALLKSQDERSKGDLLCRLLSHAPLPRAQAKNAQRLWRQLARSPGTASDAEVDELAQALFGAGPSDEPDSARKGGLLGRLLQRSESRSPNQLLIDIIGSIDWPQGIGDRVADFRGRLQGLAPEDAWLGVVREISGMAANVLDRAHQDAEASNAFLEQLTQRLQAFDSYMSSDDARRQSSRESGARLGRMVSEEMGGLSASMRSGQDLPELRQHVLDSLDRVQQHVSSHLEEENQRSEAASRQAAEMQHQLGALEQEAAALRRQVEESRNQAMRDTLTGLPNRRALEARALEELEKRQHSGQPLAVVVFDVDDFKKVNDVYGHKAGDKALALVAKRLAEGLRETDFVARYGGEEMVALLPGAGPDTALRLADGLRRRVESAVLLADKEKVRITVSGGVSVACDGELFEGMFERADQAMYQAKREGKNRCLLAP